MSLSLGLQTAISGLLTNQRALDVISQNVVNVNTPGYTRKVMTPESRVLNGNGAGVQEAAITRAVDEGLLADLRRQTSTMGQLESLQDYYPRIEDTFGQVGDDNTVSHVLQYLQNSFQVMSNEADKPTQQWGAVASAVDTTTQIQQMTDQLQQLRLEADRDVENTVGLVNEQLANIADLNNKIVRNLATGTNAEDLKDKRDTALNAVASYLDIQYYERSDGSMLVFTGTGRTLIDNVGGTLTHSATTTTDASLTLAGGNFNKITLNSFSYDLGPEIRDGKLRALLDMRDIAIPNLQANLDQLSQELMINVNQAHNRGTVMPAMSSTYDGTRIFAKQGDVVTSATDVAPTIYFGSTSLATANFGSLTFDNANATYPYRATIAAATGGSLAALTAGKTFSITGSTDPRNDGTYKVVSVSGDTLTVDKTNPRQTIQLGTGDDVSIGLFDTDGNQITQAMLRDIMQVNYSASWTSADTARGKDDYEAKSSAGPWSINEVSSHLERWLKAQGTSYANASVELSSEGKLTIDIGDSDTSLTFRDQVSSTIGADAADATISFDVDGDGTADETVEGFSNFFGLNDFFVTNAPQSISESAIKETNYKTTALTRTMRILDQSGQIGNSISIPPGQTLADIATTINNATKVTDSAVLASNTINLATGATFTISDASGATVASINFVANAALTLEQLAGTFTNPANSMKAEVIREGDNYRLRLFDTRGGELGIAISGGVVGSTTLEKTLQLTSTQRVRATVVPEGSGSRLRITNTQDQELYIAADPDAQDKSIITDLGLQHAATRTSSRLDVRSDIQSAPEHLSRGAVQWDPDREKYYLSEGDNTTALQLVDALAEKVRINSAGNVSTGSYTIAEYASASISVVSRQSSHSSDQLDYQNTLKQALDFQYTSTSGVNLDEEISNMINFQQAYSASAKVISTLAQMLEELVNIIR
jgi:flagellar hook-associated protein 1 FlgK